MSCTGCPLEHLSVRLVPHTPPPHDVMIIADTVNAVEYRTGKLFAGTAGAFLEGELLSAGIDWSKCYMTKAVKCPTPADRAPTVKEINCCKQNLLEEVKQVNPKFILVLGGAALKATLGKTAITKERGQVFEWQGAKCIATFAPGAVMRQPSNMHVFRGDLHYFYRLMTEDWKDPEDFVWRLVTHDSELIDMVKECAEDELISYDIETTALYDTDNNKLLMVGIGTSKCNWVVPVDHRDTTLGRFNVLTALNTVLRQGNTKKVAHNGKFDNRWLRSRGVFPFLNFDTYLAAYVKNVTLPHGLKYLAKVRCGANDYGNDVKFTEDYPLWKMAKYCALDVYYTRKLYPLLKEDLLEDQRIARVFAHIIMPGAHVLERIEAQGAYVDVERLRNVKHEYKERATQLEKDMLAIVGREVNWNSPKQLAEVLFRDLKLPIIDKKSPDSTAKSVLLRLAPHHPLPKMLLEYRRYAKAVSAFLEPWEKLLENETVHGREPRLHSTYNIAKTATGRLSAEVPNLQQTSRDPAVRSLICAPPGWKLVEADYSQIELRVVAFIAEAESMKQIYRDGGDIHWATARAIAGANATKEHRTRSKPVNFGFLYGMGAPSFQTYAFDTYGVEYTLEESVAARETYFSTYYELPFWHEKQRTLVRRDKGVWSPTGRFRHLPNIDSYDRDLRGEAERQAINTPVQSMASDMTLLAMIYVDKMYREEYPLKARLVGQVHDSILSEVAEDVADEVAAKVKHIMEVVVHEKLRTLFGVYFDIPIVADVKIGDGWGLGD